MKYLRIWSLVTALGVSANFLCGTTPNYWQALIFDTGTSEVFPVGLPQGQPPIVESPVYVPAPQFGAILPDRTRAIVSSAAPYPYPNIYALDLTSTPISIVGFSSLPESPGGVSLSPDGSKVYTIGEDGDVYVLNSSDLSIIHTIPQTDFIVGSDIYVPRFITISPNKPEAYISTNSTYAPYYPLGDKVFIINTDTYTVTSYINLLSGSHSYGIGVLPDGSEVYVANLTSNLIYYITVNDGVAHYIVGGDQTVLSTSVAIAPDGKFVYVVQSIPLVGNVFGYPNVITKIDTSTHTPVAYFHIPLELLGPAFVTVTPDGKTLIVSDSGSLPPLPPAPGQYMALIDSTTGSSSAIQLSTSPYSILLGMAVTPDQAPTARFTSSVNGLTLTFDASGSSSPVDGIAIYSWDFGDGHTETTSEPKISHTYDAGGTFTVTLTVTNSGGTSTAFVFTGREAKNNGGPSARLSQQVSTGAVAEFQGKVHRHHKKKKVSLHTRWSKDTMPHTRKYNFYAHDSKISSVKSKHKRHKTFKLHPHNYPHKISKKYRHYLDRKYNIRVVDSSGHISPPTFVHVVKN